MCDIVLLGFMGEGLQFSIALHFFLKHIQTCIQKKYLIFKTLQVGWNKRSEECSAVFGV